MTTTTRRRLPGHLLALAGALLMIFMAGPGSVAYGAPDPALLLSTATATPDDCDPATNPDCVCEDGRCRVIIQPVDPGTPGDPGTPSPPPGTDPPPGADPPPGGGGGDDPEPPPGIDPAEWGRIYTLCAGLFTPGTPEFTECLYGPAPDPGGPPPPAPPSEAEILQLVAELDLPEPGIGSAPCTGPGCMGAVGMPVWLWTAPWSTYTDSASIRGYTVVLTATPSHIDWDLGDGTALRCGQGTPYDTSYGITSSPTCGHTYHVTSADQPAQAYPITATMTWNVTWSGAAAGSTTTSTTQTVPVRIGEYQTVITYQATP